MAQRGACALRRLIQMIPEIMSGGPMSPDTTAFVIDSVSDNYAKAAGEEASSRTPQGALRWTWRRAAGRRHLKTLP